MVDLPQPDSPTSPSVSPGSRSKRHVADGLDLADPAPDDAPAADREVLDQVVDLEERVAGAVLRSSAASRVAWVMRARSAASLGLRLVELGLGLVQVAELVELLDGLAVGLGGLEHLGGGDVAGQLLGVVAGGDVVGAGHRPQRRLLGVAVRAASGQRGENGQPGGRLISDGGAPWIGVSGSSPGWSRRGSDPSRPSVYGIRGS